MVLSLAGLVAAGCQTPVREEGDSRTPAAYNFGTLEADVPLRYRVPAVLSASEAALRRRGYAVSAGATTEDQGSVRGQAAATSEASDVTVSARVVPSGTRIGIKVGFFGDETTSRAVMDEILRRLGL